MIRAGFTLLFVSFVLAGLAQNTFQPVPDMRTCDAMVQDSLNRLKYNNYSSIDELEFRIQEKLEEYDRLSRVGRLSAEIITIPVVVHVVHSGESPGSGKNLSFEQISSQIEVLNEDFRRKVDSPGENDNPDGADIEIEFCLAALDPDGQELAEPGVHRYNGNKLAWTRNDIEGVLKPATIWDANQYLNMWTVDFTGESETLLGYAQFPSESSLQGIPESGGASTTDGVVVQYTSFGSSEKGDFPIMQEPYNKGRTTVHEVGHYLGLRHIWGDGPCGADDFVADTPEQSGPTRGCPLGKASCGSTDLISNYMDYSDDACMNIFTKGQKTRMRAVLEVSPRRASLANSSACVDVVTEIPNPEFRPDKELVLSGGSVKFTDLSTNFPSEWAWTFEGGSPSQSTERNPTVRYDQEGVYAVTLTVSNKIGSAEPLTKEALISVSAEGVCNSLSNYEGQLVSLPMPDTYRDTLLTNPGGALAGHNSQGLMAVSEFYLNDLGYENLSAVNISFAHAGSTRDDAAVTVVVWNARGPQSSPAAVIDQQSVLIQQIQQDIQDNQPTKVVFSGLVPLFGAAFQVGVLFENYDRGDSVAIKTSPDGGSNLATSWELNQYNEWNQYALTWGTNIALDIRPEVGMNPSVQINSNRLITNPGDEVQINASGASIFQWNADDGSLTNQLGPQIIVNPTQTTTYLVEGSGVDLCVDNAVFTVFVRTVAGVREELTGDITLYPNPSRGFLNLSIQNNDFSPVLMEIYDPTGRKLMMQSLEKRTTLLEERVDISTFRSGIYFVRLSQGDRVSTLRVIKR
ncbi:MAG: M43 family zinc metalloprotease [Cyclobacteriaceae bacterium]